MPEGQLQGANPCRRPVGLTLIEVIVASCQGWTRWGYMAVPLLSRASRDHSRAATNSRRK
eukprot:4014418-Amphidinium_carterae.1